MFLRSTLVLLLLLFCYAVANEVEAKEGERTSFQIITINWDELKTPYMITVWLLVAAISKILFHVFKPLTNIFPDSSLLIVVGLIIGFLIHKTNEQMKIDLEPHTFFLYLLPPIIFDAGYFMPNRALFENLDSVLLFSVIGTLWNTFAIGGSLLVLSSFDFLDFGWNFTVFEIFIFSSLISAVDPVAVIAVFEECNVNEFLFVNVFGEALFNDGVTVVLYHMFTQFYEIGANKLQSTDYFKSGIAFFTVAIGGTAIGIIFALITGFVTKYTYSQKILAPVFIFVVPYMAYLTAEMTSLSSIIAIAVCGMVMKQYVKGNISTAAANSVKYFTKMLAGQSETVIFMFLGLSTVKYVVVDPHIDLMFISATIIFCLLYRTIGVLVQCFILNKFRHKKFTKVDQFIMSYGGLRGAIAFGLATSMPESPHKKMFVTATIAVIFFTVFLQGITIRPLVKFLNIETKDERAPTMTECIYNKYLDYMMSGIEDIAGQQGHYSFRDNFERFNAKILRPILLRNEEKKDFDASTIVRAYAKITLEDAMNLTNQQKLQHKQLNKLKDGVKQSPEYTNGAYVKDEKDVQHTITPRDKQLQKFMSEGQNVDTLYSLFSDLLDRKLREMNVTKEKVQTEPEDDIHDDYMQQMHSNVGSSSNLRAMSSNPAIASSLNREGRRQSTGGMRDKKKNFIV